MKHILIKVTYDIHKEIKIQAAYNDVTMSEFVNIALENYFRYMEEAEDGVK